MEIVDQIRVLYQDGLGLREVGEKLGMTTWQVVRVMRKYNIPRRKQEETHRIQFLKKTASYQKKENLTSDEQILHAAGLMLYWAEGAKKGKWCVDFANSDCNMVMLFVRFLRTIYKVDESRLRILLFCYPNQDISKLTNYWSNLLQIPKSQFVKPYVRKNFDEKKKDTLPYGVLHVRYSDSKLLLQIKSEIDIIQKNLNELG